MYVVWTEDKVKTRVSQCDRRGHPLITDANWCRSCNSEELHRFIAPGFCQSACHQPNYKLRKHLFSKLDDIFILWIINALFYFLKMLFCLYFKKNLKKQPALVFIT